jgi:translation initiation factor 1
VDYGYQIISKLNVTVANNSEQPPNPIELAYMAQDRPRDDELAGPDAGFDVPDTEFDLGADPKVDVIAAPEQEVHIRSQQRNGRKSLTIVQGLPPKLNLKLVLQYFKRQFCCNGTIVDDPKGGERILQLQGDQRVSVAEFLVEQGIVRKDLIKVHGVK